jgi:hypothetical protein
MRVCFSVVEFYSPYLFLADASLPSITWLSITPKQLAIFILLLEQELRLEIPDRAL